MKGTVRLPTEEEWAEITQAISRYDRIHLRHMATYAEFQNVWRASNHEVYPDELRATMDDLRERRDAIINEIFRLTYAAAKSKLL